MNPENPSLCPECGKPVPTGSQHGVCPACLMAQALASGTIAPEGAKSSAQTAPPSPEEIADKFPQFEILECLGRGGMGVVYKARQKSLDRWVAIKILAPERVGQAKFAERFEREAKTLAKLNHPNIVTVFDHGETDGLYYFVMEFVDGVNLRDLLREGKIEPKQALAIVPPVCDALQYAHGKGIVHRDIKPENLLLDREGRVKIADFGIAALVGAEGEAAGTPPYMAPEQSGTRPEVDHRADIYALGVVLYEMLTGERPAKEVVAPSRKVQIDVRLDEIVLRALEKKPELRYQQVSDVKTMVESIVATPPGSSGVPHADPGCSRNDEAQTEKSEIVPRFSRTASVGACWAGFFVLNLLAFSILKTIQSGPAGMLFFFALLPMGATAPFGATILGWVAVSQIRRSAGKLDGLGLAVFDGLFFPLLALDAALFGIVWLVLKQFYPSTSGDMLALGYQIGLFFALWLCVATFISGIVDFFIIRRVWRAVSLPSPGRANTPAATDKISERKRLLAWKIVAFTFIAIVFSFVLLNGAIKREAWQRQKGFKGWQPQPMSLSKAAVARPYASIRITDVVRDGSIVVFHIVSEAGFPAHLITVSYQGSALEKLPPSDAGSDLTGLLAPVVGPDLTGLLAPVSPGDTKNRTVLNGENRGRGPGEFRFGFVLPDEEKAEMVVKQARDLYLGKTNRLGGNILCLFSLQRLNIKDAAGKDTWQSLMGVLNVEPEPGRADTAENGVRKIAGAPFIARYPGGTIELVAVAPWPSKDQPCWRPDGSPASEPFPQHGVRIWAAKKDLRQLAVRIRTQNKGVSGVVLKVDANSKSSPTGSSTDRNHPGYVETVFSFDTELGTKSDNFQIGVGDVDWEAVSTLEPVTIAVLEDGSTQKSRGESIGGGWNSGVDCVVAKDGGMTVSYRYSVKDGYETRMVTVHRDGTKHEISGRKTGMGGMESSMATFTAVEAENVAAFEFQRRAYQWVEFRHVSLQPGHKTTVAVKDFGGESKADASPTGAFGPVMERTVHDYKSGKDWLLNLETGKTFSLPPGLDWDKNADAVWKWAHQQGIHVTGLNVASQHGLYGFEMKAALLRDKGALFETVSANGITNAMKGGLVSVSTHNGGPPLYQLWGNDWQSLFAFETDQGAAGVLQVTGFTENPRGVKIRYKLVQPAAPKSPNSSVAPIVPKTGFIRAPGEYPLDASGSVLSIPQDGLNRNIAFVIKWAEGSAQDSISVSGKPFFARPGAFAYIESAKRLWMFDGGKQLDLLTPTGRNSVAATAPFDSWPKDVSAALPGAFRENLLNPYSSAQPASPPVERFASPAPTETPER